MIRQDECRGFCDHCPAIGAASEMGLDIGPLCYAEDAIDVLRQSFGLGTLRATGPTARARTLTVL